MLIAIFFMRLFEVMFFLAWQVRRWWWRLVLLKISSCWWASEPCLAHSVTLDRVIALT